MKAHSRTATFLKNDLPQFEPQIRSSPLLTKAAVIATGAHAKRTMVVTTAGEAGEDYHLVHIMGCEPKILSSAFPYELQLLELRPTKWARLLSTITAFMDGADEEALIRISAGMTA